MIPHVEAWEGTAFPRKAGLFLASTYGIQTRKCIQIAHIVKEENQDEVKIILLTKKNTLFPNITWQMAWKPKGEPFDNNNNVSNKVLQI